MKVGDEVRDKRKPHLGVGKIIFVADDKTIDVAFGSLKMFGYQESNLTKVPV